MLGYKYYKKLLGKAERCKKGNTMKKGLLIVGGILLLLIILGVALGDEDSDTNSNGNGSSDTSDTEQVENGGDAELGSSRDNPVPIGQSVEIDGWDVKVVDTIPNATEAVLAENQFNDQPAEGRQFFIATIEATFTGNNVDKDSGQFWLDVTNNVVDDNNVTYSSMDDYCGVIPDALEDTNEVFVGGTVTGNVCWPVATDQVDSLVMFVEPTFSFRQERTWISLQQ